MSYYNSTAASHISLLYQLKEEKNVFYNVGIIEKEIYDNENLLSKSFDLFQ